MEMASQSLNQFWQQAFESLPPEGTVLLAALQKPAFPATEPQRLAIEKGWLISYASGRWFYRGKLLEIIELCRSALRRRARRLGFELCLFPRTLTRQSVEQFGLPSFFSKTMFNCLGGRGGDGVLDPVQCAPFYDLVRWSLEHGQRFPLLVCEDGGYTFRDEEPSALHRFCTAREFLRVEWTMAGTSEDIIRTRCRALESVAELFSQLELSWRAVFGRPCGDAELSSGLVRRTDSGVTGALLPVIDLEIAVPHEPHWLECAGGTLHFDTKIKQAVGQASAQPLWSACLGIGINRLVYAILAQHGENLQDIERILTQD